MITIKDGIIAVDGIIVGTLDEYRTSLENKEA